MASPEILKSVYLDHAATTPIDEVVLAAMMPYFSEVFANPASLHRPGVKVRVALQQATQSVAQGLNTSPESILWTSGGTESNNLVIQGVCSRYHHEHGRPGHLVVSAIEHSAVLAVADHLEHRQGWRVTRCPVTAEGVVLPEVLQAALTPETALVSIMHGNNEIGTLQPIAELGAICRAQGVGFHTDAVQTFGKLPLDLSHLPIDYLSASGHKMYGPKGVGLLWVHPDAPKPEPTMFGGSQQNALRPGTENVAGVIGFAKAFELSLARMADETPRLRALQQLLIQGLQAHLPNRVVINGPLSPQQRVPGNVHISVVSEKDVARPPSATGTSLVQLDVAHPPSATGTSLAQLDVARPPSATGTSLAQLDVACPPSATGTSLVQPIEGESLVLKLDLKGFAVASGSACHSGALTPSHVVLALGQSDALARATVRISMGQATTASDVDHLITALVEILARLG
jgi:cysteine desulfurase